MPGVCRENRQLQKENNKKKSRKIEAKENAAFFKVFFVFEKFLSANLKFFLSKTYRSTYWVFIIWNNVFFKNYKLTLFFRTMSLEVSIGDSKEGLSKMALNISFASNLKNKVQIRMCLILP